MTTSSGLPVAALRSTAWRLITASLALIVVVVVLFYFTYSLFKVAKEHPDAAERLTLLSLADAVLDVALLVDLVAGLLFVGALGCRFLARREESIAQGDSTVDVQAMLAAVSTALAGLEDDYTRTQAALADAQQERKMHEAIVALTRSQVAAVEQVLDASVRKAGRWPSVGTWLGVGLGVVSLVLAVLLV